MTSKRLRFIPLLSLLLMVAAAVGCNSKKEETQETYTPSTLAAPTAFSLKKDTTVTQKLDSVFFAIDLDRAIIFNPDSLPMGTKTGSLVPVISFPSTMSAVTVVYTDSLGQTVESNYSENPDAAVNLSSPAKLRVTAQDGTTTREYTVKVNVHRQNPARMLWSETSVEELPSRLPSPKEARALTFRGKPTLFIEEKDGTYTLATTDAPSGAVWTKQALTLPFTPALRSATAADTHIYMLSESGDLYSSTDGLNWSATGESWLSITAPYLDGVTGLKAAATGRSLTAYPQELAATKQAPADFPISGTTQAGTISSPWAATPTVIIYGGRKADGTLSDATWGFDGNTWTRLSTTPAAALEEAMLIPYWLARPTATMWNYENRDAWLLMGGRLADGTANRQVWYSFDNGVNWMQGDADLTLPDMLPEFVGADALVELKRRSESALGWQKARALEPLVEGTTIYWDCPEIYIFGGHDAEAAQLHNTVWRAALARFTFTPII